jgi:uncharacterized protein
MTKDTKIQIRKDVNTPVPSALESPGVSLPENIAGNDIYALVTGASRGLGKAFTVELARRNTNLLLVALPDDGLPELCEEMNRDYKIKCHFLETDLTSHGSIDELVRWVIGNYRVNILINNAGMGGSREFELAEKDYLDNMISLNIRALTLITHQLLPELKSHRQSWILNVSSMASFTPMGYKTVYPASKVFVLYFSQGLNQELKGTGVSVSVVNPGPMKTNKHVTSRIRKMGALGKIGLLTPEYVASRSIDLMFMGRTIIIPGWLNHLSWLATKTVPGWIRLPYITNRMKKGITISN